MAQTKAQLLTSGIGYTVSGLPSGSVGDIVRVSDANTPSIGSVVVGAGSSQALCWYNGTDWTVIGT